MFVGNASLQGRNRYGSFLIIDFAEVPGGKHGLAVQIKPVNKVLLHYMEVRVVSIMSKPAPQESPELLDR